MTKNENKALRVCTKKGLIDLINDPRYTQNKAQQFPAIIGYLARHGMDVSRKDEFLDLVYTARNELLAQEAKAHAAYKGALPYDGLVGLNGPAQARVKAFLRDPVGAISAEMQNLATRKENYGAMEDPDEVQYYVDLKTSANIIAIELGGVDERQKGRYEDKPAMVDILARLQKKMPENDASLSASLKRINSGFFGTLFRRKSKEYSAFETSFKEFKDAGMAYSGNTEDLEKKTTDYLKHIIPGFKYGKDMPKQEWLDALPKGKRARAEFCLDVLDSIHEHKEMKPFMENVEKAAKGQKVVEAKPNAIEQELASQEQFQNDIQNKIEIEDPAKEEVVVEEKAPVVESNEINPK